MSLTLAFSGVVYWDPFKSLEYPAREGAMYLRMKDYTVLGGGDRDYATGECGRGAMARRYDVEKDGVRENGKIVCFSRLFRAHLPEVYRR